MNPQQNISASLKQLSFLIGRWNTEGEILPGAAAPSLRITGTDSYEWVLDGQFILHRVDVLMGKEQTEAMELIGEYDERDSSYQMRSFDNQGGFTTMRGNIDGNGTFHIEGPNMRATLIQLSNDEMRAHWEMSDNGQAWQPWMNLRLRRS